MPDVDEPVKDVRLICILNIIVLIYLLPQGDSLLFVAIKEEITDCVQILLACGADSSRRDKVFLTMISI